MYFEQFYLTCLAHASYMIGSEGEAAVVDPQRDVDIYLKAADEQNLKITHILETHLHADFVSGHKELAARTGAKIYIGARAEATFPHVRLTDGFELQMGAVRIRALETPGHTSESVCLVITDGDNSAQPCAVLTGDTLFIGDVGRPDLSRTHTPRELAGLLYDSLHQKLMALPDAVMVYPAHGAGSLCGRAMRAERSSTIGTERLTNYALQIRSREEFIAQLTANLPTRPEYFLEDAEINRSGAATLTELPPLPEIEENLEKLRRDRERLGAVNLRAEEELREVEVQHTSLTTERDDLVEAIKRLRQGIQSLNREARERLLTSFETVNNHFKRLFVELFGGGEAALHLIESDDPLEAGLEIIAKPPGKKPQTLSLLSGGEQALTALALIFAVFLTNPSPICVLDEVDAPLDDHNVERFCDLLHEMTSSTETRFIIITHNPITMARMNRLFGVTMAERGVSQLVSVDLEDAVKILDQNVA